MRHYRPQNRPYSSPRRQKKSGRHRSPTRSIRWRRRGISPHRCAAPGPARSNLHRIGADQGLTVTAVIVFAPRNIVQKSRCTNGLFQILPSVRRGSLQNERAKLQFRIKDSGCAICAAARNFFVSYRVLQRALGVDHLPGLRQARFGRYTPDRRAHCRRARLSRYRHHRHRHCEGHLPCRVAPIHHRRSRRHDSHG